MQPDLHATRFSILSGATSASAEIERSIAAARSAGCVRAFVRPMFDAARREAGAASPGQPLAGLAFSVKDLFDIAGQPTPAGSALLAHGRDALADAPAVARLRAAGGALIGRTHMTEFAFSGVGVNPHHGTPAGASAPHPTLGPRIPGGSSSGAAVSVACGAAFVGLGSDTGGSIRIPAALNGLVGFKSTARLVPTAGAVPLSTTLDGVCAITRSVRDAITAHEILAARRVVRGGAPLPAYRLALVRNVFFDGIEAPVAAAIEAALARLRQAGARIEEITLPELDELASINATGGFPAAESYAWHRPLLARDAAAYDPRVAQRIRKGAAMKAHEYLELVAARRGWIARMESALGRFDALLSPTVPLLAPPIATVAPGAERDAEFFRVNALLLRNPSIVNMLDGCAISLPCQAAGELPVGLMLWHAALRDDAVLAVAQQVERLLQNQ